MTGTAYTDDLVTVYTRLLYTAADNVSVCRPEHVHIALLKAGLGAVKRGRCGNYCDLTAGKIEQSTLYRSTAIIYTTYVTAHSAAASLSRYFLR